MDFFSYQITFNALPTAITDTFVGIDVSTGDVTYKDGSNRPYTVKATDISIKPKLTNAPQNN